MDFSRRTLLAATAAGAVGTAGCLDGAFGGTDGAGRGGREQGSS